VLAYLWYVLQVWRGIEEVVLNGSLDLVGDVAIGGDMSALTHSQ
jgi:hypothetical protein